MNFLKNFHSQFDEKRLWDGKEYYKSGAVQNAVKQENIIKALVKGRHTYRVALNMKTNTLSCSCPYEGNCKHLVALLYYLDEHAPHDVNSIQNQLNSKSKEELLILIQKIIARHPESLAAITTTPINIPQEIKKLWIRDDHEIDALQEKVETVLNNIKEESQPLPLLHLLLNRLLELVDQGWNDDCQLDYCFEILMSEINNQLSQLNVKEKSSWAKTIKQSCKHADYVLDYLD